MWFESCLCCPKRAMHLHVLLPWVSDKKHQQASATLTGKLPWQGQTKTRLSFQGAVALKHALHRFGRWKETISLSAGKEFACWWVDCSNSHIGPFKLDRKISYKIDFKKAAAWFLHCVINRINLCPVNKWFWLVLSSM